MTVEQLIKKLQKVKNQNAIVALADCKGYDQYFMKDLSVYEETTFVEDIFWEAGVPEWLPKKAFEVAILGD